MSSYDMDSPRKSTSPPRARGLYSPRETSGLPHTAEYTRHRPSNVWVSPPSSAQTLDTAYRPSRSPLRSPSRSPSPEASRLRMRASELLSSADHLRTAADRWAERADEERWAASAAARLRATLAATQRDANAALSAAEAEAASAWWQAGLEREAADAAELEADSVLAAARRERSDAEAARRARAEAVAEAERARMRAAAAEAAARSAEALKSQTEQRTDAELAKWRSEVQHLRTELGSERAVRLDEKHRAEVAEGAAAAASAAAEEAAAAAYKLDRAMQAQAAAAEKVLLEQQAELTEVLKERERHAAERQRQVLEEARASRAEAVAKAEARAAEERAGLRLQLDAERRRAASAIDQALTTAQREWMSERNGLLLEYERKVSTLEVSLKSTTDELERLRRDLSERQIAYERARADVERRADEKVAQIAIELKHETEKVNAARELITSMERAAARTTREHTAALTQAKDASDVLIREQGQRFRKSLEEQSAAFKADMDKATVEIVRLRNEGHTARAEAAALGVEIERAEARLSALQEQHAADTTRLTETATRAATELARVEIQLQLNQEQLQFQKEQLQKMTGSYEEYRLKHQGAVAEVEGLRTELSAARGANDRMSEALAELNGVNANDARRAMQAHSARVQTLETALDEKQRALDNAGIDRMAAHAAAEEAHQLRAQLAELHQWVLKHPRCAACDAGWAKPTRAFLLSAASNAAYMRHLDLQAQKYPYKTPVAKKTSSPSASPAAGQAISDAYTSGFSNGSAAAGRFQYGSTSGKSAAEYKADAVVAAAAAAAAAAEATRTLALDTRTLNARSPSSPPNFAPVSIPVSTPLLTSAERPWLSIIKD